VLAEMTTTILISGGTFADIEVNHNPLAERGWLRLCAGKDVANYLPLCAGGDDYDDSDLRRYRHCRICSWSARQGYTLLSKVTW